MSHKKDSQSDNNVDHNNENIAAVEGGTVETHLFISQSGCSKTQSYKESDHVTWRNIILLASYIFNPSRSLASTFYINQTKNQHKHREVRIFCISLNATDPYYNCALASCKNPR